MARVVAVSPTLADAAQSVGGTLAQHAAAGHEVVLVLVFQGTEPAGQRERARTALGLAGVVTIDLPSAADRGYDGGVGRDGYDGLGDDDEDTQIAAGAGLAVALSNLDPTLVLSPMGLSGHVDARILNDALDALDVPRLRWLDLPYALHRTPGAPLGAGEVVAVPIGEHLDAKLAACALVDATVEPALLRDHAIAEGKRLGTGGPVEILLRPADGG